MSPRIRTRSTGWPATESLRGTGVWVGRGGRGRGPREGTDEQVDDLNGQGNDQEVFCPSHEMQKLKTELWNHVMVGAGHAAYTARFHELARLVPHLVTPESRNIKRYVHGLALQIYGMVAAIEPKTMQKAVQEGRENAGAWPKCTICNSYHAPRGPCRTCFNCNHPGHLAKDCRGVPRNMNHVNARNPPARHVISVGSGNQENQARGREFMLGAEEACQDLNIMTEGELVCRAMDCAALDWSKRGVCDVSSYNSARLIGCPLCLASGVFCAWCVSGLCLSVLVGFYCRALSSATNLLTDRTLCQKELDALCSTYNILANLRPKLPGPNDTIRNSPKGWIGLFIKKGHIPSDDVVDLNLVERLNEGRVAIRNYLEDCFFYCSSGAESNHYWQDSSCSSQSDQLDVGSWLDTTAMDEFVSSSVTPTLKREYHDESEAEATAAGLTHETMASTSIRHEAGTSSSALELCLRYEHEVKVREKFEKKFGKSAKTIQHIFELKATAAAEVEELAGLTTKNTELLGQVYGLESLHDGLRDQERHKSHTLRFCNSWFRIQRFRNTTFLLEGLVSHVPDLKVSYSILRVVEGESLAYVYERMTTIINVMDQNKVHPPPISVNTKFYNSLQPKWSKYVTLTHQKYNLMDADYDQLYDNLSQFELHGQVSKAKNAARNHDPLALVAYSNIHSSHSHASPSYSHSPQPY
nr:reverse transcriptase domain-containing protein [Tanacetum cinerariifolium]